MQKAMGPLDISPETFTREEEEEYLLDGECGGHRCGGHARGVGPGQTQGSLRGR